MILDRSTALAWTICIALFNAPVHAADKTPADLVLARAGTLPIILTVPHGGREEIPGAAPRDTRGKPSGGRGFVTVTDANTDRLALGIAAQIKAVTGKEPYVVLAKFKRQYADPNRPPEIGVESPAARPCYDYYHRSIRRFIDEIRSKYPAGLLIDVHGQMKDPNVVMRGTQNGRTVARLLERAGVPAVTGGQRHLRAARGQWLQSLPSQWRAAGRNQRKRRIQRRIYGRHLWQ
jgi:N-formylglutamate amidohydrolase